MAASSELEHAEVLAHIRAVAEQVAAISAQLEALRGALELHDRPLTLQEAAGRIFPGWSYQTLRANIRYLISEGMPAVKLRGRYLLYPKHVEEWYISRYDVLAKRTLQSARTLPDRRTVGYTASLELDKFLARQGRDKRKR